MNVTNLGNDFFCEFVAWPCTMFLIWNPSFTFCIQCIGFYLFSRFENFWKFWNVLSTFKDVFLAHFLKPNGKIFQFLTYSLLAISLHEKKCPFELFFFVPGVFSFLYLAPAIIVISCNIFEYVHMDRWMRHWQEKICRDESLSKKWQVPCRYPDTSNPFRDANDQPNITLFILKYVAIHLTAAFTGIWVCVPKTTDSWKRWFYRR